MTIAGQAAVSQPVTFEHVSKRFSDALVVNDLNLSVDDGELMVLLGPSGCGKTTSLRMLAGLETITSGTIRIGDLIVNQLPPRSRNIAMVFQSYALYSHLSVFENLAYPLKVRKLKKDEVRSRVHEVATQVQISELLDRKPKEISGGQRQRVALGRAIIRNPAVFLMDEPLSNLDAKLRLYMRGELKRFQRDLATTTIYVTHDQAEAMTLADRIAIMDRGVLQQVGKPREVYHNPANMFVAGFLGSPPMNFWTGRLERDQDSLSVVSQSIRVQLPGPIAQSASLSNLGDVVIGIRPEHILVNRTQNDAGIPAHVVLVEDLGNEVLLDLRVGDQPLVARLAAGDIPVDGDTVWLEIPPANFFLFDHASEERITN
ncbi:sn-glycerol-3-phosphate ABC transporter ATP-binding protein UgpC [soil metagenome]